MTLNEFKAQHNITIDVKFDSQIYRFGENNRYWIIGFDNREHGLDFDSEIGKPAQQLTGLKRIYLNQKKNNI